MKSRYDESEGDDWSRRGLGKKTSKDGPLALKKTTITSQAVEKDYLKELEIGVYNSILLDFFCLNLFSSKFLLKRS